MVILLRLALSQIPYLDSDRTSPHGLPAVRGPVCHPHVNYVDLGGEIRNFMAFPLAGNQGC